MISFRKFQRNPFSKDDSNRATKPADSSIELGAASWKGLLAGEVGQIARDDNRSRMTEAQVKVWLAKHILLRVRVKSDIFKRLGSLRF